jgi:hypothetical protein
MRLKPGWSRILYFLRGVLIERISKPVIHRLAKNVVLQKINAIIA